MSELDTDILDRSGRLKRIGLAMLIGGVFTFFTLRAMMDSGRGVSEDPIGQTTAVLMGVVMFVLTTTTSLKIINRAREQRKLYTRARAAGRTSAD